MWSLYSQFKPKSDTNHRTELFTLDFFGRGGKNYVKSFSDKCIFLMTSCVLKWKKEWFLVHYFDGIDGDKVI